MLLLLLLLLLLLSFFFFVDVVVIIIIIIAVTSVARCCISIFYYSPIFNTQSRYIPGPIDYWEYSLRLHWSFSKGYPTEGQCRSFDEAIIKRKDWGAARPRLQLPINRAVKRVFLWQTGSDVCHLVGLTGYRCEECLRNSTCLVNVILASQNKDFSKLCIICVCVCVCVCMCVCVCVCVCVCACASCVCTIFPIDYYSILM